MAEKKSEFWWASIAGADCEPVEVAMLEGKRVVYTCGCADPFFLDTPDCPIQLVAGSQRYDREQHKYVDAPLVRPPTPAQKEAERVAYEKKLKADAKRGIHHGWRGAR